jgi:hypothetical protein
MDVIMTKTKKAIVFDVNGEEKKIRRTVTKTLLSQQEIEKRINRLLKSRH